MAFILQIVTLILAFVFINAQTTCVPPTQTESCRCTNPVSTTTQRPKLRIEIVERDDPNRPSYPSYPDYPSYPRYPSNPNNNRPAPPMPNRPEARYFPMYSGLESPNYRPMEFNNAERDNGYYVVPFGGRRNK